MTPSPRHFLLDCCPEFSSREEGGLCVKGSCNTQRKLTELFLEFLF